MLLPTHTTSTSRLLTPNRMLLMNGQRVFADLLSVGDAVIGGSIGYLPPFKRVCCVVVVVDGGDVRVPVPVRVGLGLGLRLPACLPALLRVAIDYGGAIPCVSALTLCLGLHTQTGLPRRPAQDARVCYPD